MTSPPPDKTEQPTGVACIILAAGESIRFGPENKLLAQLGGEVLILRTARQVLKSRCRHVSIVVQPDARAIANHLRGLDVAIQPNPAFRNGIGTSISVGIASLPESIGGAFILPGDMPNIEAGVIDRMIGCFERSGGEKVIVPITASNQQRNPLLWPRRYFPELTKLNANQGGKALIPKDPDQRIDVLVASEDFFRDIDTQQDLERL